MLPTGSIPKQPLDAGVWLEPGAKIAVLARVLARVRSGGDGVTGGGGVGGTDVESAVQFVRNAAAHKIDLSWLWATVDGAAGPRVARVALDHGTGALTSPRIREGCMAVPGSGRTAMLFVSQGRPPGVAADAPEPIAERVALLDAACAALADPRPGVRLAQALLGTGDDEAIRAMAAAGFTRLGDLLYIQRSVGARTGDGPPPTMWPDGVAVTPVSELPVARRDELLCQVLERTYNQTLDCPELCGLRDTIDVLESHRSVGKHDPALWWVVTLAGVPEGCLLINPSPEHSSFELVYVGLSPTLRGRGVGRRLVMLGVHAARARAGRRSSSTMLVCAVDARNAPALRVYAALGFDEYARRVPFVKPLRHAGQ